MRCTTISPCTRRRARILAGVRVQPGGGGSGHGGPGAVSPEDHAGAAMQRLAVVTLSAMGILYYVRPLAAGIMAGIRTAPNKAPVFVDPNVLVNNVILREIDLGVTLALAIAGLAIMAFSKEP